MTILFKKYKTMHMSLSSDINMVGDVKHVRSKLRNMSVIFQRNPCAKPTQDPVGSYRIL